MTRSNSVSRRDGAEREEEKKREEADPEVGGRGGCGWAEASQNARGAFEFRLCVSCAS